LFKSSALAVPMVWKWSTLPCRREGAEVRVRVLASVLESTDVLIRRHLYPQTIYRPPPFVLGYEASEKSISSARAWPI